MARAVSASTAGDTEARIETALRRVEGAGQRDLAAAVAALRAELHELARAARPPVAVADEVAARMAALRATLHVPDMAVSPTGTGPFMVHSTPAAADLRHEAFLAICDEMSWGHTFHRKLWEWVFIVHHLRRSGCLAPGRHGIGFGVGQEPLPSFFARLGVAVTATDAPPEIGLATGWHETHEYAETLEAMRNHAIVDADTFARLVRYRHCDMTAITPGLAGFDFCWSACSLEHLGSLEAGQDFVVDSVERCLRPGGIAVHTTELNLSSDTDTLTGGHTVLYRRRDLLALAERLRDRGHEVDPFTIAPETDPLDFHVDVPPYHHNPHLKLLLQGYACTSAGLVVRRGG